MKRKHFTKIVVNLFLTLFFLSPSQINACDTWVALIDATKTGYVILAKNSDRPLFDSQPLMFYPRQQWSNNPKIDLGRIKIPQVKETFATLGSSPYWCWGYEEGINEFGVAIGNEGVFTKLLMENIQDYQNGKGPELGPTGMDYIRLGLERGKTAKEALEVITSLLEKYGQFGSGSPTQGVIGAYDNSFIIADSKEAWVLETTGKQWVAKRFNQGVTSISNKISIKDDWDLSSKNLTAFVTKKGWWKNKSTQVDFTKVFIDDSQTGEIRNHRAQTRANCSFNLLKEKANEIDISWMKKIARDRSTNPSIDLDQTASSCVAVLSDNKNELPVFWWCPSVPSNSCYIPFFVHGSGLPEIVSTTGKVGKSVTPPSKIEQDTFSPTSYWWLMKDLSDLVSMNREKRNPIVRAEFDKLEVSFETGLPNILNQAVALRKQGKNNEAAIILDNYSKECLQKVLVKLESLRNQFKTEMVNGAEDLEKYSGKYTANFGPFQNVEFTVQNKDGKLSVDVPGQMVFQLKEPDEEGIRYFTLTNTAATSFILDGTGKVTGMKMHQITQSKKQEITDSIKTDIPEDFKPYVGKYVISMANQEISVFVQGNELNLKLPDGGTPQLKSPDKKGRWYFTDTDLIAVSFNKDHSDKVTSMNFHQIFQIPKGKCAAAVVEKTIEESGIKAAVDKFHELLKTQKDKYIFSEQGFNTVGYNLLGKQKIAESIKIFELNVEQYPDSYNVYDSLGEACMKNGDKGLAIKNYKKSLELFPKNENAKNKLQELEVKK